MPGRRSSAQPPTTRFAWRRRAHIDFQGTAPGIAARARPGFSRPASPHPLSDVPSRCSSRQAAMGAFLLAGRVAAEKPDVVENAPAREKNIAAQVGVFDDPSRRRPRCSDHTEKLVFFARFLPVSAYPDGRTSWYSCLPAPDLRVAAVQWSTLATYQLSRPSAVPRAPFFAAST